MTCCVTGARPEKFPFLYMNSVEYALYFAKLSDKIEDLICEGYTHFISGMARGVDLDFGWLVCMQKSDHRITLEAAIPYPAQATNWEYRDWFRYQYLLEKCDKKTIVSPSYAYGCMQKRNQYMVDHSDLVLAVWNGEKKGGTWNTIRYAQKVGKPVRFLMLNEIKIDTKNAKYKITR